MDEVVVENDLTLELTERFDGFHATGGVRLSAVWRENPVAEVGHETCS